MQALQTQEIGSGSTAVPNGATTRSTNEMAVLGRGSTEVRRRNAHRSTIPSSYKTPPTNLFTDAGEEIGDVDSNGSKKGL